MQVPLPKSSPQNSPEDLGRYDLHFQVHVVMALQGAAEFYLTSLLEDMNLCTIHANCIMIIPKDIHLASCTYREHLHYRASSSLKFVAVFC